MLIKLERYLLVTKSRPLEFNSENNGEFTKYINDAMLYKNIKDAEYDKSIMDEPEEYEIVHVNLEFDI